MSRNANSSISPPGGKGSLSLIVTVFACMGILLAIAFGVSRFNRPASRDDDSIANVKSDEKPALQESEDRSSWVEVGGVKRPPTDVRLAQDSNKSTEPLVVKVPHGFQPGLDPNTNPQVAGVYAALKDRTEPSHFSSFAPAKEFDRAAYEKDPKPYLETIEPGRVFSPAQPGEGVQVLRAADSRYHQVKQGETVRLSVISIPGSPVTFTSFDLGRFSGSQLSSETVRADDDGVASASFIAGAGTIDDIKVLAGGPMTSGQVAFIVNVSLPQN